MNKKMNEVAEVIKEEVIGVETEADISKKDQTNQDDEIVEKESRPDPTDEDSKQPRSKTGRVINAKHVRIRKTPSLDASVLGVISEGESAIILGRVSKFYKIQSEKGITGYITTEYFKED